MKKRMLSALLAVCMMLTLLPTTALATNQDGFDAVTNAVNAYNQGSGGTGKLAVEPRPTVDNVVKTKVIRITGEISGATQGLKLDLPADSEIEIWWDAKLSGDTGGGITDGWSGLVELTAQGDSKSSFVMKGGSIENESGNGIFIYSRQANSNARYNSLTVEDGTVTGGAYGIRSEMTYNGHLGQITVKGGTVGGGINAVTGNYVANIAIEGGTVYGCINTGINVSLTVSDGMVKNTGYAISAGDDVTVSSGTVCSTDSRAINIKATSVDRTIKIEGGTVIATGTRAAAIYDETPIPGMGNQGVKYANVEINGGIMIAPSIFEKESYSWDGRYTGPDEDEYQGTAIAITGVMDGSHTQGNNEGLTIYPTSAQEKIAWARNGEGKSGINVDGTFIEIPGVSVGGTNFTLEDLVYNIEPVRYNGQNQWLEITLKDELQDKGTIDAELDVEYLQGIWSVFPKDVGTYTVRVNVKATNSEYNNTTLMLPQKYEILPAEREIETTSQTSLTLDSEPVAIIVSDNAIPEPVSSSNYTYQSSNESVIKIEDGKATPVGLGEADVTVTARAYGNYDTFETTLHFTVTKLPPQNVSFKEPGDQTATYGDSAFTNAATNNTSGGGAITYSSSDENVATVDANGKVTIVGAGTATITATAAAVEGYAETPASYTLTVNPKEITATATVQDKTYDGTTAAEAAVTFDGLVSGESLTEDTDYTVEAVFADADADTDKTVNVTITLLNKNYKLDAPITAKATISKATLPGMNTTLLMEQNTGFKRTLDLSTVAGLPEGETPIFAVQEPEPGYQGLESAAVEPNTNTLTLTTKEDGTYDRGDTVTVSVTDMKNYEDSAITVQVTYTNKTIVAISGVTIEEKTYDGTAVTYTGEPTATKLSAGTEVTDEIT